MNTLVAWLGMTDIRASEGDPKAGLGPIGQVVSNMPEFEKLVILSNSEKGKADQYLTWLRENHSIDVEVKDCKLTSPVDFGEIYDAAVRVVEGLFAVRTNDAAIAFHLSPGTPAMAAVWILLAKTRFPAQLIQSSIEQGVKIVNLPFEISAEYIPDLLRSADKRVRSISERVDLERGFGNVTFQSLPMKESVSVARTAALLNAPVLIQGESGTGKEVFAEAIHRESPRRNEPFITVNCGAIPETLVESELFGHVKNAFTGATSARKGHFAEANRGTIFLDEIGELPLTAQVKILRVLQEGEVMPLGSSQREKIDVRVISATNRDLISEVAVGTFREDLFFRLAVLVVNIPPLRQREGDFGLLTKTLLDEINRSNRNELWREDKALSPGALNRLRRHKWPGNVRELGNTLLRAALTANGNRISEDDIERNLFSFVSKSDNILNRPLGKDFDLKELTAEVSRHYLTRALQEAGNNKSKAAKLVGANNYQTFSNWLSKYQVK